MDWALVSWKNYALTPQESNQRPRDDPLYLLSHCCHMHFSRFWFQLRYLCLRSNLIAYHENNFNHLQRPKISQRAEKCLQPLLTCWVLRKCRKALYSNRLSFTVSVSFYMTDRKLAWQTERKKKQDAIRAKGDGCENISDQLVQDFYFSVHSCIYSTICNFYP